MPAPCFGQYENEGRCLGCLQSLRCIQATIAADRYYDYKAEDIQVYAQEIEEELWEKAIRAVGPAAQAWLHST